MNWWNPVRYWNMGRDWLSKLPTYDPQMPNDASSGILKCVRPISFVLILTVLVLGWFNPAPMDAFFTAAAKMPDWLQNLVYLLFGGYAGEKIIRAVKAPGSVDQPQ